MGDGIMITLASIVQSGPRIETEVTSTTIDYDLFAVTTLQDGAIDFTSDDLGTLTYTGSGLTNAKIFVIPGMELVSSATTVTPKIFVNSTEVFACDSCTQSTDQVAHSCFAVVDLVNGDVIKATFRNNASLIDFRQRYILIWVTT